MGHFQALPAADVLGDTIVRRAMGPYALVNGSRGRGMPLKRRADDEVRRILSLVSEFREMCVLKCEPHRLISVLRAVIESARAGSDRHSIFSSDALSSFGVDVRDDASRCLRDLNELLWNLCLGAVPTADELVHAMDPLIMLCVQVDATTREGSAVR
jgi:hypothetical protein